MPDLNPSDLARYIQAFSPLIPAPGYNVLTSRHISAHANAPGFLLTLTGRPIIGPADQALWPAREYLAEHRREWRL